MFIFRKDVEVQQLTLFMHISLDGYVSNPSGDFGMFDVEPEILPLSLEVFGSMSGIVFGRGVYTSFDGYWGHVDPNDPAKSPGEIELSRIYKAMHPYVVSTSLEQVGENATLIQGDVGAQLAAIKQQPGRGLMMIAGPDLVATCLEHQLIDRILLNVYPIVLGAGIPLFKDLPEPLRFRPISAQVFASGVVSQRLAVDYRKTASDAFVVEPVAG